MKSLYKKAYDLGFGDKANELDIAELEVKGTIPQWLQGTLLRNGPGSFRLKHQDLRHWFDGLAMLHRFSFKNGKVSYRNRFLQSNAVKSALKEGKISYSEFATDPCRGMFKKVTAVFDQKITDSAKVNIQRFEDKFIALGETPLQIEFDPQMLNKIGEFVYDENLSQHVTTVHPHYDQQDGYLYNLVTHFGRVSEYRIVQVSDSGEKKIVARKKVNRPGYIHSWGLTKNYFILTEYPYTVYPAVLLFHVKPFIENYKWNAQHPARFHVFKRSDGQLENTFETEAFFAFHHINAFEQDGNIICDINTYKDPEIIKAFYLESLKDEQRTLPFGNIRRFTLNLADTTIHDETMLEECIELTRFDYDNLNMDGRYQYIYGVSINKEQTASFYNQLIKFDIKNRIHKTWFQEGCFPGEPVFARSPNATAEDDGLILSVVLDSKAGNSFLLILDAQTFEQVARADVPEAIMFGYHGAYYDDV